MACVDESLFVLSKFLRSLEFNGPDYYQDDDKSGRRFLGQLIVVTFRTWNNGVKLTFVDKHLYAKTKIICDQWTDPKIRAVPSVFVGVDVLGNHRMTSTQFSVAEPVRAQALSAGCDDCIICTKKSTPIRIQVANIMPCSTAIAEEADARRVAHKEASELPGELFDTLASQFYLQYLSQGAQPFKKNGYFDL